MSSGDAFQPFRYSVGRFGSKFLVALRDEKKFLAVKCGECSRVYSPPHPLCGPCYKKMDQWLEVGPLGTLTTFTILRFQFIDPETGQKKPVPYGYGFIKLDGSDTNFQHFVSLESGEDLHIGMRVRPVFEETRTGDIRDIRHFEPVPGD
ncbi:MAG: hypothetical protein COB53_12190 [Elusimicrobia bacterium]|nr:MAG: hypothetical protein COB53_12190 [Elusimicrobiota bacterium]